MRKSTILKYQFIIGITIAYLLLIGSFLYYLRSQNQYISHLNESSEEFHQIAFEIRDLEMEIFHINRINENRAISDKNFSDSDRKEHISNAKNFYNKVAQQNSYLISQSQKQLSAIKLILDTLSIDSHVIDISETTKNTDKSEQYYEYTEIQKHFVNLFIQLSTKLKEHNLLSKKKFDSALYISAGWSLLALAGILFVLIKITKIIEKLALITRRERKINKEFTEIRSQIEENNWILSNTNDLYEEIAGVDDVREIADKAMTTIASALSTNMYAAALYVKESESDRFQIVSTYGLEKSSTIQSFNAGEGILGECVSRKDIKTISTREDNSIKLRTGIIEDMEADIIFIPLGIESGVKGILELMVAPGLGNNARIKEYLKRSARNLASFISFGQHHTVVQSLLQTTQKQTEELEAQQEELRITNEELIYKTNLLESSEEELRVQQEELSQTNKELNEKAEELEKRNLELNDAKKVLDGKVAEVEQASKYKSEFMANMSHELRTPLNSILILAKLLSDNKTDNLSTDQVKYATVIHSAGSDLLSLINDLLDLAKIESGNIEIQEETIETKSFVNNLEDLFKHIAKDKSIDYKIDLGDFPETFYSDLGRLDQILKNFLSNAFKFSDKNGQVKLILSEKDDLLFFSVADNGRGISAEKQELIFEAFKQEDGSTSRKYGGTGLGLSICKEVAKLLHGYVTVESELGKGSVFTLALPYVRSDDHPKIIDKYRGKSDISSTAKPPKDSPTIDVKKTDSGSSGEKSDKKLLIVEDDFNFADILKDFAEESGFLTFMAHDGETALTMAEELTPDAIILDVMLPVIDGWEVLKKLKSQTSTQHIPVHMMSAADFNTKDILEKGAIGFLPKPVSEDKINSIFADIWLNIDQDVKKVLLVEDQEVLSEHIRKSFAEKNINILQAFSVQSALKKLQSEDNIDCVILDLTLPDGSGLDLLETIKSDPNFATIPVIINTAQSLTTEQMAQISKHTKSMVLKDGVSTNRLIDEVNLFLDKISDNDYEPILNNNKFNKGSSLQQNVLKDKRVLLVDDDMRNIFALSSSLEDFEMNIDIATNGVEAVDKITNTSNSYDVVLMDIMMPEMDGYEAIEQIRKNKKFSKLPIIAVTAKAMKGDRERVISIGANDYISKPIDLNKLKSLLRVWLSH